MKSRANVIIDDITNLPSFSSVSLSFSVMVPLDFSGTLYFACAIVRLAKLKEKIRASLT